MRRIFDIDNPVMRVLIKIFDSMCLSVIWIVFSLPVFTMGAASAALYLSTYRYIRRGEGYLWRTFWNGFKENFRRSTLAWLAAMAILGFLGFDIWVLRPLAADGGAFGILYRAVLILTVIAITWTVYLAAYSARFKGTVREVIHFSALLMRAHPIKTLEVLGITLAGMVLVLWLPAMAILAPAGIMWGSGYVIEDVFLKHMRPEDVERTNQENQGEKT